MQAIAVAWQTDHHIFFLPIAPTTIHSLQVCEFCCPYRANTLWGCSTTLTALWCQIWVNSDYFVQQRQPTSISLSYIHMKCQIHNSWMTCNIIWKQPIPKWLTLLPKNHRFEKSGHTSIQTCPESLNPMPKLLKQTGLHLKDLTTSHWKTLFAQTNTSSHNQKDRHIPAVS